MNCIRAQKLIKPYVDGELSGRELEEFLDHIESCSSCRDELVIYYAIDQSLRNKDDGGDYDFKEKLSRKLAGSRSFLRRQKIVRSIQAAVAAAAEGCFLLAVLGMLYLNGNIEWLPFLEKRPVLPAETESEAEMLTESGTEPAAESESENRETLTGRTGSGPAGGTGKASAGETGSAGRTEGKKAGQ